MKILSKIWNWLEKFGESVAETRLKQAECYIKNNKWRLK
jgi:hypothetical protein